MAMRDRLISILSVGLVAVAIMLVTPTLAAGGTTEQTEDILRMADGRVLHGRIISEDRYEIVFEYIDRRLGLKTKLRLNPDDVLKIERNVVIVIDTPVIKKRGIHRASAMSQPSPDEPEASRYGHSKYDDTADDGPTLYRLPFNGTIGTDSHPHTTGQVSADTLPPTPDIAMQRLRSRSPRFPVRWMQDQRPVRGAGAHRRPDGRLPGPLAHSRHQGGIGLCLGGDSGAPGLPGDSLRRQRGGAGRWRGENE